MPVLAHIAGLPVQESLMYVAPVLLVVGWIYWAGRRERRRTRREDATAADGTSGDTFQLVIHERSGR